MESPASARKGRALVVDDDRGIQRLMSRMLALHGLQVDLASDGGQGLRRAVSTSYDVVVLDLQIPGLHGMTVLRRLLSTRPGQPVIVCSCQSDRETKATCMKAGARGFVAKPFSFTDLSRHVLAALGQTPHVVAASWSGRDGTRCQSPNALRYADASNG